MQYPHMGSLAGDRVDYYYFVADSGERRWPSSGSGSSDSRSSESGSGSSTNGWDGREREWCLLRSEAIIEASLATFGHAEDAPAAHRCAPSRDS
jgi:hypothetical protein